MGLFCVPISIHSTCHCATFLVNIGETKIKAVKNFILILINSSARLVHFLLFNKNNDRA
jgi:hypothetical protein